MPLFLLPSGSSRGCKVFQESTDGGTIPDIKWLILAMKWKVQLAKLVLYGWYA